MPTAVDIEKYRPRQHNGELRDRLGLSDQNLIILFVGSLIKSKGLDVLIEAIGKIYRQIPAIKLILTLELKHAGFDERTQSLQRRIDELGIRNLVIELGMIDFMPELVAEADVVVSPYRDTQGPSDYPLAMMEGMACARCVLGTTVGGIPELVSDGVNGRLVAPADHDSLAAALIDLLEDTDLRRQLGTKAREYILASHSPKKVAKDHLRMYEDTISHQLGRA
jgi:glycosyltransferase involved in cell wall biosynthesis